MKGLLDIFTACEGLAAPAALATLVRVKGSSYRKPGAQMVVQPDGFQTGLISAGCLETDVKVRVEAMLAGGSPQLAVYEMGSDLDLIWGTGMGCQGRADVLMEPLTPGAPPPWLALAARMLRERRSGALATVFGARGNPGLKAGDRFVLDEAGPGLLPEPGPFRASLVEALRMAQERGGPASSTWTAADGEVDLLVEPILPPIALWIFGAGEHARPLAKLARALGWWLGLVDHRPALATPARFPEADRIIVGHPPEVLEGLPLDRLSAALVVSHVYELDKQWLTALLQAPLGYLGLQGSRTRSARLLNEIQGDGPPRSEEQERILHWPAGLDLGGETPEATALAMVAEIQATLAGHSGGSLKYRSGSIHSS